MYEKRVKVFLGVASAVLLICLARLGQLQLLADPSVPQEIDKLKELRSVVKQFKTLRGKILDRHGEILTADMPQFQIFINYRLSRFFDDRVKMAKLAGAAFRGASSSSYKTYKELDDKRQDLERIIDKCSRFGVSRAELESRIKALNDRVWNAKSFLCWFRNDPDPNLIARYKTPNSVPLSEALRELERRYPDPAERDKQIMKVADRDLPERKREWPLVELRTEDDVCAAQLTFTELDDIDIVPTGRRYYPYRAVAAQTIGWVGQATQPRDVQAFADDPLASYLKGEVCGREDGVEYVCESILRGRRGEAVYDIDGRLVRESETEFGRDVQLTLDIDLQEQIERRLTDPQVNPEYCRSPMAGAIIDVNSGDILALVSLPTYDLNQARYDYADLVADANQPTRNRALNGLYPPGSVAKPAVLIAGLESGAITPNEVISCPAAEPPTGWPRCLIWWKSHSGHDLLWKNNARNATKGSCNVYFSHLADRIDARELQEWLFRFGYGREVPLSYPTPPALDWLPRRLQQTAGQIGSTQAPAYLDANSVDQLPALRDRDRKMFGIGQGNFRVTPLQVANVFATLARRGRARPPRLFLSPDAPSAATPIDLPISPANLNVVYDGMSAVVNEHGGTAYDAFLSSGLKQHGVKVYGKTGSTEGPFHAWFAGFAEDREGRKVALAVVVEGGQHGGGDAGPLAREILQLCVQAGYLGEGAPAAAK
jgi:penicillin-binding protein 2